MLLKWNNPSLLRNARGLIYTVFFDNEQKNKYSLSNLSVLFTSTSAYWGEFCRFIPNRYQNQKISQENLFIYDKEIVDPDDNLIFINDISYQNIVNVTSSTIFELNIGEIYKFAIQSMNLGGYVWNQDRENLYGAISVIPGKDFIIGNFDQPAPLDNNKDEYGLKLKWNILDNNNVVVKNNILILTIERLESNDIQGYLDPSNNAPKWETFKLLYKGQDREYSPYFPNIIHNEDFETQINSGICSYNDYTVFAGKYYL